MKMSTRGRYGMRLMLDITVNGTERPVALKEIAQRQEISGKYLEQIISRLSKAGLVRGTRGVGGGYLLSMPPEKITAGDILRALEGNLTLVECKEPGGDPCHRAPECPTTGLWREMCSAMEHVADSYTLADLVEQSRNTLCGRLA